VVAVIAERLLKDKCPTKRKTESKDQGVKKNGFSGEGTDPL
jgi:hypothetical protein